MFTQEYGSVFTNRAETKDTSTGRWNDTPCTRVYEKVGIIGGWY